MPKQSILIPLSIALLVLGVVLWVKDCKPNPTNPIPNSDTQVKEARNTSKVIDSLKQTLEPIHDTILKWKDRWHAAKTITVPAICDSAFKYITSTCDSLIKHDSLLISGQTEIIHKQDTLINKLWQIHSIDSTAIVMLTDSCTRLNKKLRRQKILTKVAAIGGVLLGGVIGAVR